jgi:hypothetical protein
VEIDYTPDGQAQVAECNYKGRRLIVRRTRLTDTHQAKLWPDWRHFAFLTDLDGDATTLDAFHRQHAVVELTIRDLKEGAGMEHVPSGDFDANSAWLQCAVLEARAPQSTPGPTDRPPQAARAAHRRDHHSDRESMDRGESSGHIPHRPTRRLQPLLRRNGEAVQVQIRHVLWIGIVVKHRIEHRGRPAAHSNFTPDRSVPHHQGAVIARKPDWPHHKGGQDASERAEGAQCTGDGSPRPMAHGGGMVVGVTGIGRHPAGGLLGRSRHGEHRSERPRTHQP